MIREIAKILGKKMNLRDVEREREREILDLPVWMTECACANYVRKSHARPPRGWPRAKSDSFNVILKYSASLRPSREGVRGYIRYVRTESSVMAFPIFDLPLDPRTFSLSFQVERERWVSCYFFNDPRNTRAALSRDNYDTYAFRFVFSPFLSSS